MSVDLLPGCDNCGNGVDVAFDDRDCSFLCPPCLSAKNSGDQATFDLRRELLR